MSLKNQEVSSFKNLKLPSCTFKLMFFLSFLSLSGCVERKSFNAYVLEHLYLLSIFVVYLLALYLIPYYKKRYWETHYDILMEKMSKKGNRKRVITDAVAKFIWVLIILGIIFSFIIGMALIVDKPETPFLGFFLMVFLPILIPASFLSYRNYVKKKDMIIHQAKVVMEKKEKDKWFNLTKEEREIKKINHYKQ